MGEMADDLEDKINNDEFYDDRLDFDMWTGDATVRRDHINMSRVNLFDPFTHEERRA